MKKNLTKVGNSWAILLPKTILELIKVNPESKEQIELEIEGDTLKIKKAQETQS